MSRPPNTRHRRSNSKPHSGQRRRSGNPSSRYVQRGQRSSSPSPPGTVCAGWFGSACGICFNPWGCPRKQSLDCRQESRAPQIVPAGVEMDAIRREAGLQRSVRQGQRSVGISEEHDAIVGQPRNEAAGFVVLAAAAIAGRVAGQYRQHDDPRARQGCAQAIHDFENAQCGLGGRIADALGVIRADGEHNEFRRMKRQCRERAVIKPPEQMLRRFAADAEVRHIAIAKPALPRLRMSRFPSLHERITEQDEIGLSVRQPRVEFGDTITPLVVVQRSGHGGRRGPKVPRSATERGQEHEFDKNAPAAPQS